MNQLILYKKNNDYIIFHKMIELLQENEDNHVFELAEKSYEIVGWLIQFAEKYGLSGDLWKVYLTYMLVTYENPFTIASEKRELEQCSISEIAKRDLKIIMHIFHYDLVNHDKKIQDKCLQFLIDYKHNQKGTTVLTEENSKLIQDLTNKIKGVIDENQLYHILSDFYLNFGVGKFSLYKAFECKAIEGNNQILPIYNANYQKLDDIIGYEIQKKQLIENTEKFIAGNRANNVLLFGDSGTGKSSSVKALLNEYYMQGLRMIEVYKHQFNQLPSIMKQLRERNYKFIIFMDDLSFEEFEIDYKYLKAIIEGGLENKPENVLIYATSNRRHLIRETWRDREDKREDVHGSDTREEKLSLSARFGLTISYMNPNKEEYLNIVKILAKKEGIHIPIHELEEKAMIWEMRYGGMCGRTAEQFIKSIIK